MREMAVDSVLGQHVPRIWKHTRPLVIESELLEPWARERLAPYKVPRAFVVVDGLPTNAVGKVVKPAVIELLLEQGAAEED